MVEPEKRRAHGQTGAEAEAKEAGKELDKPVYLEPEQPIMLTRAFQRMRTDWHSPDHGVIQTIKDAIEEQLDHAFEDVTVILYKIHDIVREPEVDRATGEIRKDEYGLTIWKRRPDGSFYEDWSKITRAAREQLLYEIVTKLYSWEQMAADAWGEALFAKAVWEEAFATGFDSITDTKATVDARNARANKLAADHRYLAVYKSYYSKKAEAVIRSMDRLCQRLKDLNV